MTAPGVTGDEATADNARTRAAGAIARAQATTAAISAGAILGFIALVLGAVAAWFGGVSGTRRAVLVDASDRRVS